MNRIEDARQHVDFWRRAAAKTELAWLDWQGDAATKERRRLAFEFADRVRKGWEDKLDELLAIQYRKTTGLPLLELVKWNR